MAKTRAMGWRPSPPDFRDHLFSVPRLIQEALPPAIDLTAPEVPAPFTPVFQQGTLGSCGPQTAAGDLIFAALRQQNLDDVPMPSRLFIYYNTRQLMGTVESDSGVDNRSLLKALARWGWCDEDLWPHKISQFKQQPPGECYQQAQSRKIIQYLSVPQTLTQMKGCLASGDPFIFGFSVYESMMSDSVERTGNVPMPRQSEAAVGGHDVLVVGYNDASRTFKFRNSWGREWGANGYGTIPYEYAANTQMAGDFWTVRHSAIPTPTPPTPVPPDPPIPVPPSPTPTPPDDGGLNVFQKLILKVILDLVTSYEKHAATTASPLDDMLIAMVKNFLTDLLNAKTHADILDAPDNAKASFAKAFPKP